VIIQQLELPGTCLYP